MFVYQVIDFDLRFEMSFLKKEWATEEGRADFEQGVKASATHFYWGLRKIVWRACLLCNVFVVTKNAFIIGFF